MRIKDEILNCVIYLYPSRAAAESRENAGGSGFVVGVESAAAPGAYWLYAVTNRHVVENGASRTILFNTQGGRMEIFATDLDSWVRAEQDDLAVYSLTGEQSKLQSCPVTQDQFITPEILERYRIGPGDEAFMVGRFVIHAGEQTDIPSVRFGNVSMMPALVDLGHGHVRQESFLVEMRSSSGYSGSPVFVYIPPSDLPFRRIKEHACGPWLLGINCAHFFDWGRIYEGDKKTCHDELLAQLNTGMAAIIPAWKLRELLNDSKLVKERKRDDEVLKRSQNESPNTSDVTAGCE